ncbi:MAG: sugar phosphate isomerase/epimerase [Micromonosporaceae bacterium]|nr:sugar phosphate isomerase/epimerase [Micromonosporaceae bacterium]
MNTAPASGGFASCLNAATLSGLEIPEFLAIAASAGFGHVEMSIQQVQATGADRVRTMLDFFGLRVAAASGILPAGPVLPAPLLVDEPTYRTCLHGLDQRLATFAAIGCPIATIVLNPRTRLPRAVAEAIAIRRLTELAAAGADHGVRLAVETIGLHRDLDESFDGPTLVADTLPQTADLLRQVPGDPMVLVDSFHWAASGADPDHITSLGTEAVGHVHLADTPSGCSPDALTDTMRLFPGDGNLPWPAFTAALAAVSYHGVGSVELFNPDLRALPDQEIARRTQQGASICWHPGKA